MEQLVLSVEEAAKALSIGRTKFYEEIGAGRIVASKLGKRTLITRESLNNYIASLEAYPSQTSGN